MKILRGRGRSLRGKYVGWEGIEPSTSGLKVRQFYRVFLGEYRVFSLSRSPIYPANSPANRGPLRDIIQWCTSHAGWIYSMNSAHMIDDRERKHDGHGQPDSRPIPRPVRAPPLPSDPARLRAPCIAPSCILQGMKALDISSHRFGRLTALRRNGTTAHRKTLWLCRCDCGQQLDVTLDRLRSGKTKSCGCYRVDFSASTKKTHGLTRTRIYRIWAGMLARCRNPKHPRWRWYGGRGISVCSRWDSFEAFYEDMGALPSERHSIERKEVNGNYEPDNCIWLPLKEQARNRRLRTLKASCPKGHPLPIIHGNPAARKCKLCRHERYVTLRK